VSHDTHPIGGIALGSEQSRPQVWVPVVTVPGIYRPDGVEVFGLSDASAMRRWVDLNGDHLTTDGEVVTLRFPEAVLHLMVMRWRPMFGPR